MVGEKRKERGGGKRSGTYLGRMTMRGTVIEKGGGIEAPFRMSGGS